MSETPQPRFPIAGGNLVLALMFGGVGFTSLIVHLYFEASAWLCLMVGALVLGSATSGWKELPLWRRALGGTALVVGATLAVIKIVMNLQY